MIFDTFLASDGEPFGFFDILLGSIFEVFLFTTFEGNRQSAINSDNQRERGCGVPRTITSMPSLRARTDPEQAPHTQGSQGRVEESQTGGKDHKGTE